VLPAAAGVPAPAAAAAQPAPPALHFQPAVIQQHTAVQGRGLARQEVAHPVHNATNTVECISGQNMLQ
jgi:hypothetical protein